MPQEGAHQIGLQLEWCRAAVKIRIIPGAGEILAERKALDRTPTMTVPGEAVCRAKLRDAGPVHESTLSLKRRINGQKGVMISVRSAGAVEGGREDGPSGRD